MSPFARVGQRKTMKRGVASLFLAGITWACVLPSWTAAEEPRAARDALGDPLPRGAIARLGTTRFRHLDRIFGVAFAPDGKTVASASPDDTAAIWDAKTGKKLHS